MAMLKIGYDAKRAAQNRTGLGNYSRLLVGLMRRFASEAECVLYVPSPRRARYLGEVAGIEGCRLVSPHSPLGRLLPAFWRSAGIGRSIKRDGIDLYHGLSGELPWGIRHTGARAVVTVHDLIFLSHPHYYHSIDRFLYERKLRYACRVADRVVAISQFTKQELQRRLLVPEGKIEVVYQGQQLDFGSVTETDRQQVRQHYGLPQRYVLYVGTLEERKNLLLVARAMARMKQEGVLPGDLHVVAIGRATPYLDILHAFIGEQGLQRHFTFLHDVGFCHLPVCYLMADFFVYPSRIEGFGIPMLEAAAAGLPAVGCTGSSLEEAGGEGAFYVDPDDAEAMADCMLRLWNDPVLRKERSAMGLAHAERFSEKRLFDDLMAVYQKVISL